MPLFIAAPALKAMLAAAEQAHPAEACGILLGRGERVAAASVARNVHPCPSRHFEIDPAALIAAHKAARGGGPAVLGYWHSHPGGRAGPSDEDQSSASGDGRVWVIVASGAITVWSDGSSGFTRLGYVVEGR